MLLFVIILILISNFSFVSQKKATRNVNQQIVDDATDYAAKLNYNLTGLTYVGQSAAALLSAEDGMEHLNLAFYAKLIKGSIPTPYLVAIVDMDGKGAYSDGKAVDLSSMNYFVTTQTQKYMVVENDGLLNRKAFVSIVPIYKGRDAVGMIYLYSSIEEIQKALPYNEYDGNPSFAVMDSQGSILTRKGTKSYYTGGGNFISKLEDSTLNNITPEIIVGKLRSQSSFTFSTQHGNENKTIAIAPLGIGDFHLVMVLNQAYIDLERKSEWSASRTVVMELAVAVVAFLCLFLLMLIINKVRYNEQSKNLADKADTDLLTELYNKIATERKIQEYMTENPESRCLMFLFDFDNFKKINDTMGHAFGDEVLRSLGHQLSQKFRVTDIIGRTGGDEFIVFLKNIKNDEQLEREGMRILNFFH